MKLLARRLPTILGLLMLAGVAGVLWWWWGTRTPIIAEGQQPNLIRITNNADNKFAVSWVTETATEGKIEYGPVGGKIEQIVEDDRGNGKYTSHHVTVSGLQPSSEYAFRILAGETNARFDNNGRPYSATTGAVIGGTPPAESVYGEVKLPTGEPAEGAIVYLTLPGAVSASTLVKASGTYSLPLSTIRSTALNSYLGYEPSTVMTVNAQYGSQTATATVKLEMAAAVPLITIGQTHDFTREVVPAVAHVEPTSQPASSSPAASTGESPSVFNVEPLGDGTRGGGSGEVKLLNPAREGEVVATTLPEFRGVAPGSTVLAITVHSNTPYSDTVIASNDGTWAWSPPDELEPGEHVITIAYLDTDGIEQIIERTFTVSKALAQEGDPSFEATPSGSTASPSPSPSPSLKPSPTGSSVATASPRVTTPSTQSGVPVSGVLEYTWLTAGLGLLVIVLGVTLLAL